MYDASQLKGLFGSSCCGAGAGQDTAALADAAAGKIWSARFKGVKPQPASVADEVSIEPARKGDLSAVEALLTEAGLPTDVEPHLGDFLVARHRGNVIGCTGMEAQGRDALFRSLAVSPDYRGSGIGRRLFDALVARARAKGVERAYLLTTTIAALAESWGFQRIDREKVPATIRETTQFKGACCASAVAMWQDLRPVTTLSTAREIGLAAGLKFVYTGNVPGDTGESTFCPACGATLIERWGFQVGRLRMSNGRCARCDAAIEGVWQ